MLHRYQVTLLLLTPYDEICFADGTMFLDATDQLPCIELDDLKPQQYT